MQRFTSGSADRDLVQRMGYEAGAQISRETGMQQRLEDTARGMLPEGTSIHIETIRNFPSGSDDDESSSSEEDSSSESSELEISRSSDSQFDSDLMSRGTSFMDGEEDEDMELDMAGEDDTLFEEDMDVGEDEDEEDVEDDIFGGPGYDVGLDDGLDDDEVDPILMDEENDMEHPEELPDDWASGNWRQATGGYWGPGPGGNDYTIDALDEEAALFRDGPGGPRIEVRVRGREGWPTAMPAHMVGDLLFGGFQRYFAEQASVRGPRSRSLFSAGGDGAGGAASHPLLLRPQRLPVAGGSNSRVENEQSARPWASNFPAIPRSARGRFLVASEENENEQSARPWASNFPAIPRS